MNLSQERKEYAAQEFKGLNHKGEVIRSKEFESCTFLKCSFRESLFQYCTFRDCIFRASDLSLVRFEGCAFVNCQFESCELIGINWTEAAWPKAWLREPVHFVECALNHSIFIGMSLRGVGMTRCVARNVDFEECDMTKADCRFTDFTESRFLHTNLTQADFTGARNYAIAAHANTLKRTKFSLPEAMALLYSLDIVLTEC